MNQDFKLQIGRKNVSSVVVATDFSKGAKRALKRTQHLPLDQGAKVVLVHVLPSKEAIAPVTRAESISKGHLQRELESLRTALDRLGRQDVRLLSSLVSGDPSTELVTIARESSADVLLVGRRGTGTFKKLLLGSVSERVVNAGQVPTLIVGPQRPRPYETPLVALPGDESLRFILDAALRVLPGEARKITIISAVTVAMEGWLWSGWISSKEILRLRALARQRIQSALERLLAPYRMAGILCRVTIQEGDPRRVILNALKRRMSDLLVLGTSSRTGIFPLRLGSVSAHVIRYSSCDVLVVPPPNSTGRQQ